MSLPEVDDEIVAELRRLIVLAAPDPDEARPVETCAPDQRLDELIPFSSLIVLGTIVAIEDRFEISVTRAALARAGEQGVTLLHLARLVRKLAA